MKKCWNNVKKYLFLFQRKSVSPGGDSTKTEDRHYSALNQKWEYLSVNLIWYKKTYLRNSGVCLIILYYTNNKEYEHLQMRMRVIFFL